MQSTVHDILVNGHDKLKGYSNTKAVKKNDGDYIQSLKEQGYVEIFENDELSDLTILGLPVKPADQGNADVKEGDSNG